MRVRHRWEGTSEKLIIRVEVWSGFPLRARTCLYVNDVLAAADNSAFSMTRLIGESDDDDGRRDVVVTIRGNGWSSAENLITVTHDGQPVAMRVVQTRWFTALSPWVKLPSIILVVSLSQFTEELVGNRWIEFPILVLCMAGVLVADAVAVYPSNYRDDSGLTP